MKIDTLLSTTQEEPGKIYEAVMPILEWAKNYELHLAKLKADAEFDEAA